MLLKTITTREPRNNLVVIIEGIFVTADVCIGFWVCDLRRIFFFSFKQEVTGQVSQPGVIGASQTH